MLFWLVTLVLVVSWLLVIYWTSEVWECHGRVGAAKVNGTLYETVYFTVRRPVTKTIVWYGVLYRRDNYTECGSTFYYANGHKVNHDLCLRAYNRMHAEIIAEREKSERAQGFREAFTENGVPL